MPDHTPTPDPHPTDERTAMRYRKKPVVIEATQWFKNGDHPDDNTGAEHHDGSGLKTEGEIVRYYIDADGDGTRVCEHCGVRMHDHGWIDTSTYTAREYEVVKWVNETRARYKLSPVFILPKGKRNSILECPVAKALGDWACVTARGYGEAVPHRTTWQYPSMKSVHVHMVSGLQIGPLPGFVSAFISDFDAGRMPWLEG